MIKGLVERGTLALTARTTAAATRSPPAGTFAGPARVFRAPAALTLPAAFALPAAFIPAAMLAIALGFTRATLAGRALTARMPATGATVAALLASFATSGSAG